MLPRTNVSLAEMESEIKGVSNGLEKRISKELASMPSHLIERVRASHREAHDVWAARCLRMVRETGSLPADGELKEAMAWALTALIAQAGWTKEEVLRFAAVFADTALIRAEIRKGKAA